LSIGSALREGLNDQELKQLEIALETNYSEKTVSAWVTENRRIPKEVRSKISQKVDHPYVYLEMQLEATGGVGIPVLNGDFIDTHPAAMKDLVQIETNEALDNLEKASMIKPIHLRTEEERQEMRKVVMELLDAIASMTNLVAVICKEYKFSMKELFGSWRATLKARRWNK
jgi:transcriptional regulator with XRE-family HTH domain